MIEVTPTPTPIPSGGYVSTALTEDVVTFNPLLASDNSSRFAASLLYGGMLQADPFSGELVCHLCSSWTLDGQSYTFVLRDDIEWSDGEPVTADDFVYTYAALLWGVANENLDPAALEAVEGIESVAKVDDRTVRVTVIDDNCGFMQSFTLGWLPQHRYGPAWELPAGQTVSLSGPFGDADDPDFSGIQTHEMNQAPEISSGPMLFEEWVPGDHITLVRNAGYFKGVPFLDGVVLRIVPDQADQVRMLRTGELDIVERFPPSHLTEIELTGHINVFKTLSDSYFHLGLQVGNPGNPQPRWVENEDTGEMMLNEAHGQHPIL